MTVRVIIDQHRCIGAGNCIFLAPTAFRWRDGNLTKADLRDPDTVDEETLRMASASCPTNAIDIEDEDDIWTGR